MLIPLCSLCNFLVFFVVEKSLNTKYTKELHKGLKDCELNIPSVELVIPLFSA